MIPVAGRVCRGSIRYLMSHGSGIRVCYAALSSPLCDEAVLQRSCGLTSCSSQALDSALHRTVWQWRTATAMPASAQVPEAKLQENLSYRDPVKMVKGEIENMSARLRLSIVSQIPALERAADYFFQSGAQGKRMRPTVVMLMASALSDHPPDNGSLQVDLSPASEPPLDQRRQQQRVAEIAEMIHVASLLHDDVIDNAETRRGRQSLNMLAGNKVAILAGDFLLARASLTLSSLRNCEVVRLHAIILENLVAGEMMQLTSKRDELLTLNFYLSKTYFKTASLIANCLRSVAVLGNHSEEVCELAYQYGRNVGIAFQVVDDILDFTQPTHVLGKPALNDLKGGVVTAPALLALEQFPEMEQLIVRKFQGDGDQERALKLIEQSNAIASTRKLAETYAQAAINCVQQLPTSDCSHARAARDALIDIAHKILDRSS